MEQRLKRMILRRAMVFIGFGLLSIGGLVGSMAAPARLTTAPSLTPLPMVMATQPQTPWPPDVRLRLDVHVEANAQGEGSAHVVASSQGGQALAHIDTKGQASGHAAADAPALPPLRLSCNACAGVGPLATGDRETGDKETGDKETSATPMSGQVVVLVEANLRAGPSLGSGVVGGAHAGDRYAVTGRSAEGAWWRVCCVEGQRPAWVYGALVQWVDPLGPWSTPPRPEGTRPQGGGMVTPTPLPTATPTPTLPFAIVEQEQHSEANYATLYVWVQDGHGVSLEGYSLQVSKDGAPLTVGAVRFGETQPNRSTSYRQGTTRPSAAGGPEDKPYNLKLAFDPRVVGAGFAPAGAWTVQLLDPEGQPAAVVALFALRPDDDHMEMYLNYARW